MAVGAGVASAIKPTRMNGHRMAMSGPWHNAQLTRLANTQPSIIVSPVKPPNDSFVQSQAYWGPTNARPNQPFHLMHNLKGLGRAMAWAWIAVTAWLATESPGQSIMATGNDGGLWVLRPQQGDALLIQYQSLRQGSEADLALPLGNASLLLSGQVMPGGVACAENVLWIVYESPAPSPPSADAKDRKAVSGPPAEGSTEPRQQPRVVQSVRFFPPDPETFGQRPDVQTRPALPTGVTPRSITANQDGPWALVRVETGQALAEIDLRPGPFHRPDLTDAARQAALATQSSNTPATSSPLGNVPNIRSEKPAAPGKPAVPVERLIKLDQTQWVGFDLPSPWQQGQPCWLVMRSDHDPYPALVTVDYAREENSVICVYEHDGQTWQPTHYPIPSLISPTTTDTGSPTLKKLASVFTVEGQIVVTQLRPHEKTVEADFFLLRAGQARFIGTLNADVPPSSRWTSAAFGNTVALLTCDPEGRVTWTRMTLQGHVSAVQSSLPQPRTIHLFERADFVVWTAVLLLSLAGMFVFWKRDPQLNQLRLPPGTSLADLGRRLSADAIDLLPCIALTTILFNVKALDLYKHWPGEATTWQALWPGTTTIALLVAHTTVCELIWHKTLGKAILGMKVADLSGRPPKAGYVLLRNLTKALDLVAWPLIALIFIGPHRQRLGDLMTSTVIVQDQAKASSPANPPEPPAPSKSSEPPDEKDES